MNSLRWILPAGVLAVPFAALNTAEQSCEELAYQKMPAGKYDGPRQRMTDKGTYDAALCAWVGTVREDETLAVRAYLPDEWIDLQLKREKNYPRLRWSQQLAGNVTAVAEGGRWKPNIYVITLRLLRGKKMLSGERYFFVRETEETVDHGPEHRPAGRAASAPEPHVRSRIAGVSAH